jgi:response regulator RpfG family c-di-GMP phosphodiesterase
MVGAEGFESYVGVPLIAKGRVQGVLEVFHRRSFAPDAEWMDFLNTLAGQAAIAIDNGLLFSDLERTNAELTRAYDKTLEGWSHALELRDIETYDHTRRVTDRSLRLARAMGFQDEGLIHLRRGALLHDIGKLAIPDRILLKPGPLNGEEWQIMCRHPVYAYELLVRIPFLRPAIDIPYCHHERWDGKGYPRGLKGEEIPLSARIFAVVDVADALHSVRRYSRRWPKDKIRDYIANQAGLQFDPAVVEKFLTMDGGDFFETFFESGYETDDSSSMAATHWRPA